MDYSVKFRINGKAVAALATPSTTLLEMLRETLGVKSVKRGCLTGDCGVCTVLLDGRPVNACLVLALTVEGKNVTTVEALGTANKLHPLQEAFHTYYAAQCGFCTPGMLLVGKALLEENPRPSREEVVEALEGNLCRCTGYVKIVEAIQAAAEKMAVTPAVTAS